MSAVIDANLLAALVLPLPYSEPATGRLMSWKETRVQLIAPALVEYEVASILRRAVVAGLLTNDLAIQAIDKILALDVCCFTPTPALHKQALLWAERLGHSKTYDAHYLALAEREGIEFWTVDRRLANGARQAGAAWVHWIGEE